MQEEHDRTDGNRQLTDGKKSRRTKKAKQRRDASVTQNRVCGVLPERRKQVASEGGRQAHAAGLAKQVHDGDCAVEAGKLGGAGDRRRSCANGSDWSGLGGLARRKQPVTEPSDEQAVAPPTVPSDEPCDKEASREK